MDAPNRQSQTLPASPMMVHEVDSKKSTSKKTSIKSSNRRRDGVDLSGVGVAALQSLQGSNHGSAKSDKRGIKTAG